MSFVERLGKLLRPAERSEPAPGARSVVDFDFEAYCKGVRAPVPDEAVVEQVLAVVVDEQRKTVKALPAFPRHATEIMQAAQRPDIGIEEMARLVGRDPAIAAEVVRLSNSAFFRGAVEIGSLRDATMRLGLRQVASVSIALSTRALLDVEFRAASERFAPQLRRYWEHAMIAAMVSERLATRHRFVDPSRAFLAGFFHNLGGLLGLRALGLAVIQGRIRAPTDEAVTEAVTSRCAALLGREAAAVWSFPDYLADACVPVTPKDFDRAPERLLVQLVSGLDNLRVRGLDPAIATSVRLCGIKLKLKLGLDDLVRCGADIVEVGPLAAREWGQAA